MDKYQYCFVYVIILPTTTIKVKSFTTIGCKNGIILQISEKEVLVPKKVAFTLLIVYNIKDELIVAY